jgi:hypothetical protein
MADDLNGVVVGYADWYSQSSGFQSLVFPLQRFKPFSSDSRSIDVYAIGNVKRTAARIYLQIIGIQMVVHRKDSPTEIINEK